MRYFNTYGPVNEIEHYVVPRSKLVTELVAQIEQGKYFTIYAPRQMGKTTLLRRLRDVLLKKESYLPITLSFGGFENLSEIEFLDAFHTLFRRHLLRVLPVASQTEPLKQLLTSPALPNFFALGQLWQTLHELLPQYHIVQIIDEIDGMPQSVISDLLQTWREIYLGSAPPRPIHSVVLIGLQNIATLNLGRSSPFNIARELQLPAFTRSQTEFLLNQYTTESGQPFAEGVIEELFYQTGGHPFLVNRLAAITTEEIATNRQQPITSADLSAALQQLLTESNYNFEALFRRAEPYKEDLLNILFGAPYKFTLTNPLVRSLTMHGIISKTPDGSCRIANPIYATILSDYFRPLRSGLQAAILVNGYDFRAHRVNNQLQMDQLLSRFRAFVERRGGEAFKVTPTPLEATGQYLLMAYLEMIVRDLKGDIFTEVDTGSGRMDIIVVHQGKRYIIETKIWRGQSYFDQGLPQLAQYLESEGEREGYLVVFHARPQVYGKLTYDQLEFTIEHDGKTIHVYLVRLGGLFEKK